jgi:hypothetical protein
VWRGIQVQQPEMQNQRDPLRTHRRQAIDLLRGCATKQKESTMKFISVVGAILAMLLASVVSGTTALYAGMPQTQQKQSTASSSDESGCSLLPVTLLDKVLADSFQDPPLTTKVPPAYDGPWGSSCQYFSKPPFAKGHQTRVDFIVYVEASSAQAKETFDKVAPFFTDKNKQKPSGVGDEAYWDRTKEAKLHVLKGKVHYSLGMQPWDEKQLLAIASALSSQL